MTVYELIKLLESVDQDRMVRRGDEVDKPENLAFNRRSTIVSAEDDGESIWLHSELVPTPFV